LKSTTRANQKAGCGDGYVTPRSSIAPCEQVTLVAKSFERH